jgi:hypothetical protein
MASRCGLDDFLTASRTGNVENTLSEEAVVFRSVAMRLNVPEHDSLMPVVSAQAR